MVLLIKEPCNLIRWEASSNVNVVIRAISNLFITFLQENFIRTKKHIKAQKAQKAQNAKQATFFLLDVFYAHENAAFFVFVRLDNFKLLYFL